MIAASEARERSYGILNVLDDINDKIIQATKDKKDCVIYRTDDLLWKSKVDEVKEELVKLGYEIIDSDFDNKILISWRV